jgi:hypothetical protein
MFVFASTIPSVVASTVASAVGTLLITQAVPTRHLGKVLGLLNSVIFTIGKLAPHYSSILFSIIRNGWHHRGLVAFMHYLLIAVMISKHKKHKITTGDHIVKLD